MRSVLDLLAQVGDLPDGPVVDLGCGSGNAGPVLARRWPDRALIGVDSSGAMLAAAAETEFYTELVNADIALWTPGSAPALIFSNAALHWLPDHAGLLPRLAGFLAPGGVLAVQMPRQNDAPSHRLAREIAAQMFAGRYDPACDPTHCAPAADYDRLLSPWGNVTAWETVYVQRLDPVAQGHPVRAFTESTVLRPILDSHCPEDRQAFLTRYDCALDLAYPCEEDGTVLFEFRRCFFTLKV